MLNRSDHYISWSWLIWAKLPTNLPLLNTCWVQFPNYANEPYINSLNQDAAQLEMGHATSFLTFSSSLHSPASREAEGGAFSSLGRKGENEREGETEKATPSERATTMEPFSRWSGLQKAYPPLLPGIMMTVFTMVESVVASPVSEENSINRTDCEKISFVVAKYVTK